MSAPSSYKRQEVVITHFFRGKGIKLISLAKKRGCIISGGEIDSERVSNMVIDEYRAAKIGRISLDIIPANLGDENA